MTCECLGFVHDLDLIFRCVDCGTALQDVDDGPDPDDLHAAAYWRSRIARIEARRNTPAALLASIVDDEAILARARTSPPAPGSLAAMAVEIARDRRRQTIAKFAAVETNALFARISGRRPD